jgi:hypothetical protein
MRGLLARRTCSPFRKSTRREALCGHYIQCFITGDRPAGPNLGDTDGIVELWFDNIDGFNAFANSPSYLNVIKLDEERFADPKKCEYFFSEERTIIK